MFLSDRDIRKFLSLGYIYIDPAPEVIQPASVDLHLSHHFKFIDDSVVYIKSDEPIKYKDWEGPSLVIPSGGFVLASTVERVTLSEKVLGRLEGKSSLGRMGLTTHVTAGFFDPGYSGHATLELVNVSGRPLQVIAGMKICQMSFAVLRTAAEHPYGSEGLGSKYQNQGVKPEASKYHENWSR